MKSKTACSEPKSPPQRLVIKLPGLDRILGDDLTWADQCELVCQAFDHLQSGLDLWYVPKHMGYANPHRLMSWPKQATTAETERLQALFAELYHELAKVLRDHSLCEPEGNSLVLEYYPSHITTYGVIHLKRF